MAEPSALGIDLGTTFSVVAQVSDAGRPAVLPNAEGSPTTPSVVLFDAGQGETRIVVPVLEGESGDPDLCRRVGVVVIDQLPGGRPAHRPVHVTMSLNRDGILQVSATDVMTGAEAAVTIVHAHLGDDDDRAADQAARTLPVE